MPRQARHPPGGVIYHVLNRAAGRRELFSDDGDYAAFAGVLARTVDAAVVATLAVVNMEEFLLRR
jgi:hypothetical protein